MGQTSEDRRRTRIRVGAILAAAAIVVGGAVPRPAAAPRDQRPNVVLILSDDQTFDSLPHDPPVMPFLQSAIRDPSDHWVTFPNAFVNTPLCCPSRASILTGQYSHHTGVRRNRDGFRLDEGDTLALWLHDAGYTTGLFGKYLNRYPFGAAPYVPPGWDRWAGKIQGSGATVYYDYDVSDQGYPVAYDRGPADYSTDVFARMAVDFVRTAPADRPFFLMLAPSGPHSPWTPAPRDRGSWTGPVPAPPSVGERDVSDKPAWVRALPPLGPPARAGLREDHRLQYETLGAVDAAVRSVVEALRTRGDLANTIIVYLSDNGYSYGEHRWVTKSCPYEECIRTPFVVRVPGTEARTDRHLVSSVDVAPTIAELAGVRPGGAVDGISLVPLLQGRSPPRWRDGVLSEYVGSREVPGWWELRTADVAYVEYATGERELYDLTGVLGSPDPYELENRVDDPRYASLVDELAGRLGALRAG
jgi:arylsulfatase A-like enzyme